MKLRGENRNVIGSNHAGDHILVNPLWPMGDQSAVKMPRSVDFRKTFIYFAAAAQVLPSDFRERDTWLPRRGSQR